MPSKARFNILNVIITKLLNKINVKKLMPLTVVFLFVQYMLINSFCKMISPENRDIAVDNRGKTFFSRHGSKEILSPNLKSKISKITIQDSSRKRRRPLGISNNKSMRTSEQLTIKNAYRKSKRHSSTSFNQVQIDDSNEKRSISLSNHKLKNARERFRQNSPSEEMIRKSSLTSTENAKRHKKKDSQKDITFELKSSLWNIKSSLRQVNSSLQEKLSSFGKLQSRLTEMTSSNMKVMSGEPITSDGIYWSEAVERLIPTGIPLKASDTWVQTARQPWNNVQSFSPATWFRCGGKQNAFVTLADGSGACARSREPHWWFMVGESLSYWLSHYLHMDSVPPVVLSYSNMSIWSEVSDQLRDLKWQRGGLVSLVKWADQIDNSARADVNLRKLPKPLLSAYFSNTTIYNEDFKGFYLDHGQLNPRGPWSIQDIVLTAQWSSMIVFDYLTGNYDRMSSMQDGAALSNRSEVMKEPVRNLRASQGEDKLWQIDNESGLLDAYSLLYDDTEDGRRHHMFHEKMLRTTCIFSRSLVKRLKLLSSKNHPAEELENFANEREPILKKVDTKDRYYQLFKDKFPERIRAVVAWIEQGCLRTM